MPELPEVECIRLCLQTCCSGASVRLHTLQRSDIVGSLRSPRGCRLKRNPKPPPVSLLDCSVLASFERKGKQLSINTTDGRTLVVRLGMSGQLLLVNSFDPITTHVHASWRLDSKAGARFLLFRDPRRFGSIIPCASIAERDAHWNRLGPDALTVTEEELVDAFSNRSVELKSFLLNQACVSGLGNIYVDEALFLSRLHPKLSVKNLTKNQIVILASSIRKILRIAITAGGTTLRDYCLPNGTPGSFQTKHKVYGRAGLLCTICKSVLLGATIAGRTSCYCAVCQNIESNSSVCTVR